MIDLVADDDTWEGWSGAVARRCGLPVDEVEFVLRDAGLRPPQGGGKPHQLRVIRVDFAGFMPEGDGRRPFTFTWDPPGAIGALATTGRNQAGKSSVLEVLRWAIRGRSRMKEDVRHWIRQVLVEIDIDDERLCVVFRVEGGEPDGGVLRLRSADRGVPGWPTPTARDDDPAQRPGNALLAQAEHLVQARAALWIRQFGDADEMEREIGALMLDRLGFDRLSGWQRVSAGIAAQADDGASSPLGWPLWSTALGVGSLSSVIGDKPQTAQRLLQIYLGTPWAGTAVDARGAVGAAQQLRSADRRRRDQDAAASAPRLDGLLEEERRLTARLDEVGRSAHTAQEVDRRLRAFQTAAVTLTEAEGILAEVARRLGASEDRLEDAEADLVALSEDRLARRFFHSVTPTCCPRCDTRVSAERMQREQDGRCSLCDEELSLAIPLQDSGQKPNQAVTDADVDLADDLSPDEEEGALRSARDDLRDRRDEDDREHDRALRARNSAQAELDSARTAFEEAARRDPDTVQTRETETRLAVVRALIAERSSGSVGEYRAPQDERVQILEAAEAEAKSRRDRQQKSLLPIVNEHILDLGQRFGIPQLEWVGLNGAAHLPVRQGGVKNSYSKLTAGEQLRLKVATAVALLRVGRTEGVGRHPGLILIDSLGAEEMAEDDLAQMLGALRALAEERDGPQVLIFSARGHELSRVLRPETVRTSPSGRRLW